MNISKRVFAVLYTILFICGCAWFALGQDYNYRIVDPLRGDQLSDINAYFWGAPWVVPNHNGHLTISSEGLLFSGSQSYLGFLNGPPFAVWVLSGDFRVSVSVEPFVGGRYHFAIYETNSDCSVPNEGGYAGIMSQWGIGPRGTLMNAAPTFYLIVKSDDLLTIYEGNDEGVSEETGLVVYSAYSNPVGYFIVYMGTGGGSDLGQMLVSDVEIETAGLSPCVLGTTMPDEWAIASETDEDGDGIANDADLCEGTAPGAVVDADGCSIDQYAPCDGSWKNHGQFVSAVAGAAGAFLSEGLISDEDRYTLGPQASPSGLRNLFR